MKKQYIKHTTSIRVISNVLLVRIFETTNYKLRRYSYDIEQAVEQQTGHDLLLPYMSNYKFK